MRLVVVVVVWVSVPGVGGGRTRLGRELIEVFFGAKGEVSLVVMVEAQVSRAPFDKNALPLNDDR